MAAQAYRLDPLTGEAQPYLDLKRLLYATAKKSRARLELAERQLRYGDKNTAEATAQTGYYDALNELALSNNLWPESSEDHYYLELLHNMDGLQRVYQYIQSGKNPFGYGPDFVPFHYRPDKIGERGDNNYEQTKWIADDYLVKAKGTIETSSDFQQVIDDNYTEMQAALTTAINNYDSELDALCPDLTQTDPENLCGGSGAIYIQLINIQNATLRIEMVNTQSANQLKLIKIEEDRAATVSGIYSATAQLITRDGELLADYAQLEAEQEESDDVADGIAAILGGITIGALTGAPVGPIGAVIGGVVGGIAALFANTTGPEIAMTDTTLAKEELIAQQQATVQWAQAQIVAADSAALIKQYFLKFAELRIDKAIALNNLLQETAASKTCRPGRSTCLWRRKKRLPTKPSLIGVSAIPPRGCCATR